MYYANCEWYVDMGEHNKPLCERKSLRPAKCSECPVYIRSIEKENAKLRELVRSMWVHSYCCISESFEDDERHIDDTINRMRELGMEVEP